MTNKELMESIMEMHVLQKELGNAPDNLEGEECVKFEKMLALRSAVLQRFGLPELTVYCKIFDIDGGIPEMRAEYIMASLAKMARIYHDGPVKTREEIVKDALERNADPAEFLAEINLPHHSYFRFLYYQLLLVEKITVNEFISECEEVDSMNLYDELGKIELKNTFTIKELEKISEIVKEHDLKFVWNLIVFNMMKNERGKLNFEKFWKKMDASKKLMDSDDKDSIKF